MNQDYINILLKSEKYVVGLMSGTSMDGIDAALVRIVESDDGQSFELLHFLTIPYPPDIHRRLSDLASAESYPVNDLVQLNVETGIHFAFAVKALVQDAGIAMQDVDLIGSHGQTVRHLPLAKPFPATLQIGDPSYIAQQTGVITVGDFRMADMAAGGQGAPLVPMFDFMVFGSPEKNRAVLNIGGIANVTILPAGEDLDKVLAFDTGPGNTIVDNLCKTYYARDFDKNGEISACGKVHFDIVDIFLKDKYFAQEPPKSTGPEHFDLNNFNIIKRLGDCGNVCHEDAISTMTYFTARSIFEQIQRFSPVKLDELYVSGGGVNNCSLMQHLHDLFKAVEIYKTDDYGLPSDAKEAMCFAIMANETLHGAQGNVPSATGAIRPVVLGKICLP